MISTVTVAQPLLDSPGQDAAMLSEAASDTACAASEAAPVARQSAPVLPTQHELPCSDGVPMETERHRRQMELLINTIEPWLAERYRATGKGSYVSGDMFVYFSAAQTRKNDFRGPDVFIVLDVEPGERKSWVVWEQEKSPDIVIELLSESTRQFDKTGKKDIYQERLRVPEYYWFDPHDADDFAGFSLCNGQYKPILLDEDDCLPSRRLGGLRLTRWRGRFHDIDATWLRWSTSDGALLLTEAERAARESERAAREAERAARESERAARESERAARESERAARESERAARAERAVERESERAARAERAVERESERAERESERAARMARKLRELGIDPDLS